VGLRNSSRAQEQGVGIRSENQSNVSGRYNWRIEIGEEVEQRSRATASVASCVDDCWSCEQRR
jgi:hypothetical protein